MEFPLLYRTEPANILAADLEVLAGHEGACGVVCATTIVVY